MIRTYTAVNSMAEPLHGRQRRATKSALVVSKLLCPKQVWQKSLLSTNLKNIKFVFLNTNVKVIKIINEMPKMREREPKRFCKFVEQQLWLWFSWQSGHLRYERSAVRIHSLAKFIFNICLLSTVLKTNVKKKEAGNGLF